jgi:hypothetical protein
VGLVGFIETDLVLCTADDGPGGLTVAGPASGWRLRLGVPARSLPLTIPVQIDQQFEVVHRLTVVEETHDGLFCPDGRKEQPILPAVASGTVAPGDEVLPWGPLPIRAAITLYGVEQGETGNAVTQRVGAEQASQERTEMPGQSAQLPAQIWCHPTPPLDSRERLRGGGGFDRAAQESVQPVQAPDPTPKTTLRVAVPVARALRREPPQRQSLEDSAIPVTVGFNASQGRALGYSGTLTALAMV